MAKIFVFDDKTENMTAAEAAITSAGHTMAKESWKVHRMYRLALTSEDTFRIFDAMASLYRMVEQAGREHAGMITDLMFVNCGGVEKPSGIMVALHAIFHHVPVVICSLLKSRELNHHSEPVAFIHDGYKYSFRHREDEGLYDKDCPFGWVEDKDWSKAVKLLEERLAR